MTKLTDRISVSPQIGLVDIDGIKAEGFDLVICNRPDMESEDQTSYRDIQAAVEAAGMRFAFNPVSGADFTAEAIAAQGELMGGEEKVFAYCRTGTRSTILWALSQKGKRSTDEIIATAAQAGYDISHLAPML